MDELAGQDAYRGLIADVQAILAQGRARAMASVAQHRFVTYHGIGSVILARQAEQGWGPR